MLPFHEHGFVRARTILDDWITGASRRGQSDSSPFESGTQTLLPAQATPYVHATKVAGKRSKPRQKWRALPPLSPTLVPLGTPIELQPRSLVAEFEQTWFGREARK
jgi:hypothetical protein